MGEFSVSRCLCFVISFFAALSFSFFVSKTADASDVSEDVQAVFITSLGPIFTIDHYKKRVTSKYPHLKHEFKWGPPPLSHNSYKDSTLEKTMVFLTEGSLHGSSNSKVEQALTYKEISPGLWKLISLDASSCIKRKTRDESPLTWFCDELWHPIAGDFGDAFLVDHGGLDPVVLSKAIGREVKPYTPPKKEEALTTLFEVKKKILKNGFQWREEKKTWSGFQGQSPDELALEVTVSGTLDEQRRIKFHQSFLYFYKENQMILGSVEGQFCEFIDRMDKFICKEVNHPTRHTPFPYKLRVQAFDGENKTSSQEESTKQRKDQSPYYNQAPPLLSCGLLNQNYSMLLKFHFQRSLLEFHEVEGIRKAFSKIAYVLDPEKLLVSDQDREVFSRINKPPYLFAQQVEEFKESMGLGLQGECLVLKDLTEEMRLNLQEASGRAKDFLSRIKKRGGTKSQAHLTSPYDLELWSWTLQKASELKFFSHSKSAAIDIALGGLKHYIEDSLELSENLEMLMTASFFKEDAYSHLINKRKLSYFRQSQAQAQSPSKAQPLGKAGSSPLYFGLRVIRGLRGHYILSLHPQTQKNYGLRPGDEIIEVNGRLATLLNEKEMDEVLIDTTRPLRIKTRRGGEEVKELRAKPLDLLQISYTLSPISPSEKTSLFDKIRPSSKTGQSEKTDPFDKTTKSKKIFKLELRGFPMGLSDKLEELLRPLVEQKQIELLVIDLRENSGGDSEEARRFLSLFIKEAVLFYYKIGFRGAQTKAQALGPSPKHFVSSELPLVVLTSDKTMSAAEIVASSLKDHNRALLVGGRTFGKFVGQRVFPMRLSDGTGLALNVTVAEFFSPKGQALNGLGVEPHIKTRESNPPFKDGNRPGVDILL